MKASHKITLAVSVMGVWLAILGQGQAADTDIDFTGDSTVIVNSISDVDDKTLGDGKCETLTAGECTLRAAIRETNQLFTNGTTSQFTIKLPGTDPNNANNVLTYQITVTGSDNSGAKGDLDIKGNIKIVKEGTLSPIVTLGVGVTDRIFEIRAGGSATLDGITVQGGNASSLAVPNGGGILVSPATTLAAGNLTLNNVLVTANQATSGGGIYNQGTLTITNSTIGGTLPAEGVVKNGICQTTGGNQASLSGGGIEVFAGTVKIVNSTISGNITSGNGGGINGDDSPDSYSIDIRNTTIAMNCSKSGGGIYKGESDPANFPHTIDLRNTLIASNQISTLGSGPDCQGNINSSAYSLVQKGTLEDACNLQGDLSTNASGDPKIGALQTNGGSTMTHALAKGSTAIDKGDPAGCKDSAGSALTTDQRGFTSPVNGASGEQAGETAARCDIGAYEFNACGDSVKDSDVGEECDDGNATNGDGCTTTCLDEDKDDDGSLGSNGQTADCNDNDATIRPGATETCNGKDDDCDGSTDETFTDKGTACTVGTGACAGTGTMVCKSDGTVTTCSTQASNPGTETCNGIDDDCDGSTDEGLGQTTCGVGACMVKVDNCVSGKTQTCTAKAAGTETCNGIDDDCDGTTDEELGQTTCGQGICQVTVDNCKSGQAQTCAADETKKVTEICDNSIDEDCDGKAAACPATGTTTTGDGSGTTTEEPAPASSSSGCTLIP